MNFKIFYESSVQKDKVQHLLDSGEFVFYFKSDGSVFGAPEESRIIYAKMRHPDEDAAKNWGKEASFVAINLDDIVSGEGSQKVFFKKDLSDIKIIDQGDALEELSKKKGDK